MDNKLNLKNDIVFKAFFSKKGNEKYLKEFLESLLKIHIKKIEVKSEVSLLKLFEEEKGGRLDIRATLNDGIIVNMENKLNQWLAIIDGEDRRLIEMAVVRNKTIKEAKNEVEYLTGDEEVKRINELKDKWERDRVSEMNYLKSIAQKEGLKEGRKSGLKEGLKEGRKEKSIDIAKNMLDKDFSIKEVVSLTGLSEEEVKTLKNDIKNI